MCKAPKLESPKAHDLPVVAKWNKVGQSNAFSASFVLNTFYWLILEKERERERQRGREREGERGRERGRHRFVSPYWCIHWLLLVYNRGVSGWWPNQWDSQPGFVFSAYLFQLSYSKQVSFFVVVFFTFLCFLLVTLLFKTAPKCNAKMPSNILRAGR